MKTCQGLVCKYLKLKPPSHLPARPTTPTIADLRVDAFTVREKVDSVKAVAYISVMKEAVSVAVAK